ncbi:hypothetical protein MBH78_14935 [Oceanimonas sp. NS1]|nr:hypothetical protein [Oceanimonas sp. NS1]
MGAGAFTLYPTTMSYACGKMHGRALVRMTQKLMFAYSIGSLTGPVIAGMMLERFQAGLFLFIILLVAGGPCGCCWLAWYSTSPWAMRCNGSGRNFALVMPVNATQRPAQAGLCFCAE